MNLKTILIVAFLFMFSIKTIAQKRFQYLTVEFSYSYSDSVRYSIDTSGLKTTINPFSSNTSKFKTANQLFNALGMLGWELYLIEDFPNIVSQARDNYNGTIIQGRYNLYRENHLYSKRKVYFKIEIQ